MVPKMSPRTEHIKLDIFQIYVLMHINYQMPRSEALTGTASLKTKQRKKQ